MIVPRVDTLSKVRSTNISLKMMTANLLTLLATIMEVAEIILLIINADVLRVKPKNAERRTTLVAYMPRVNISSAWINSLL